MRHAIIAALLLAGCTVPQDAPGTVHAFNGETVTIRGGFDLTPSAEPIEATPGMVSQAREVCPGATYLSATPNPDDVYTYLYLFKC